MRTVWDIKGIPNPGSDNAVDAGCKCPVLDNGRGKGAFGFGGGSGSFWINGDCKLHSKKDLSEKGD